MKRYVGYLLIVAGFLLVALGVGSKVVSGVFSLPIPPVVSNILGILLIVGGLYLSWSSTSSSHSKVKHASAEVPIYEGEGKDRKIVGYKKVDHK